MVFTYAIMSLSSVRKEESGNILFVYAYIDNPTFTRNNLRIFEDFSKVSQEFEMSDIALCLITLGSK